MIQVILLLLKIIGIVLAVLLLTVLMVLALVLFVPIRYRAKIIHNPEKDDIFGRVSFLFPLVVFRFRYFEKVFSYKGSAFGVPFMDSTKEKTEKKEKPKKQKKSKKEKTSPPKESMQAENKPEQTETAADTDTQADTETKEILKKITPLRETSENTEGFAQEKQKKPRFFEKIRDTILGILQKISRLLRQKDELVRILEKQETKDSIHFAWGKLKKTILHIIPKKVKGYLIYGSDDPATTGQVLGIISAVYAMTGPVLRIVPDFERARLECDLEFRGRLQVFTILVIVLKVYFHQELKQLLQEIKNIKEIE